MGLKKLDVDGDNHHYETVGAEKHYIITAIPPQPMDRFGIGTVHHITTTDLLLLKVKHYYIDESIYHNGYIYLDKLDAVSRLAGNDYAEIGKIFTVERP